MSESESVSEMRKLIISMEKLNASLVQLDSTLGAFYEEKYGGKKLGCEG